MDIKEKEYFKQTFYCLKKSHLNYVQMIEMMSKEQHDSNDCFYCRFIKNVENEFKGVLL